MDWTETNSYLKGITNNLDELPDPLRVASFDLDDTLIHRPKGKLADQKWKLLDSSIIQKIAELVSKKYIIVIFSNQSGMGTRKNFDKPKWRKAMNDLIDILMEETQDPYYFAVYVSKTYDLYRKPNIGLWEQMKIDLKQEFNLTKLRISKKSFFCGDAAGRINAGPFKKKIYPKSNKGDFADTDRKFALNIGIQFLTPEEFFLTDTPKMKYQFSGINPNELIDGLKESSSDSYEFVPRKKELIILIAAPGSGKTEFAKKYIVPHGYVHVNQDTCKTKTKCLELAKKSLEKGKSVVVDNTNPDIESRQAYTALASENDYKHIRAIILNTSTDIAKHLNNVRHIYSKGQIPKITDIVYNIFKKNYVKPQKYEHFDKIETVDFYFDPAYLEDAAWKRAFMILS